MDGADTRRRALEKLEKFTPKIGYPVRWRDYSSLRIDPADLMASVRAAHAFELHRQLTKIGEPIDRDEWFMTPQTVNACYNPGMNEIVFPAAILQDPFFDPDRDDAANYGAIGAVIGHEIGHGFDDRGSKYDGDGRLTDWERRRPASVRSLDPVTDRAVQRPGADADSRPARERSAHDRGEHRGQRQQAASDYRAWIDPRDISKRIVRQLRILTDLRTGGVGIDDALSGSLDRLIPAATDFLNRTASPLLRTKHSSEDRARVVDALTHARSVEQARPVADWVTQTKEYLADGEEELRAGQ
jgi:hypothetical protein